MSPTDAPLEPAGHDAGNERLTLGFVTARLVECGFIAVGIVSVLAVMTLRQDPAGTSDSTLVALGQSLVAVHDATFLLGPGFVVGVGNGLILGYFMTRVAPRSSSPRSPRSSGRRSWAST